MGSEEHLIKSAWALGKNVNEIELNVWEFNRGAFYERVGYETMSRRMRIMLKYSQIPNFLK
jgi:hypothetical protein